jgi:hypothetical protein
VYQPLTDGICDDVLDVVEGIAGETEIELMQEEKGIWERYDSDKKMYIKNKTNNPWWAVRNPPPWKGANTLCSVTPMMQSWWMHTPLWKINRKESMVSCQELFPLKGSKHS